MCSSVRGPLLCHGQGAKKHLNCTDDGFIRCREEFNSLRVSVFHGVHALP
jgi:hypothetical protein